MYVELAATGNPELPLGNPSKAFFASFCTKTRTQTLQYAKNQYVVENHHSSPDRPFGVKDKLKALQFNTHMQQRKSTPIYQIIHTKRHSSKQIT